MTRGDAKGEKEEDENNSVDAIIVLMTLSSVEGGEREGRATTGGEANGEEIATLPPFPPSGTIVSR